jgi:hypothetical protein
MGGEKNSQILLVMLSAWLAVSLFREFGKP